MLLPPYLDKISNWKIVTICTAIRMDWLDIWKISKVTTTENSDIVILWLIYSTDLTNNRIFKQAHISTRVPAIGENITIVWFKSSGKNYSKNDVWDWKVIYKNN